MFGEFGGFSGGKFSNRNLQKFWIPSFCAEELHKL